MLTALAFHGLLDLELQCRGDLPVDEHHSVEDCGIALGQALHDNPKPNLTVTSTKTLVP